MTFQANVLFSMIKMMGDFKHFIAILYIFSPPYLYFLMVRNFVATCLLPIGWKVREKELCPSWATYDQQWMSHAKSLDWLVIEAC